MIIDSPRTLLRTIAGLWTRVIPIALYIGLITWLDLLYHFEEFNVPLLMVTVLGTVIGLLLAFRTNSCYGRWWEARTLWGAIVNDSRTWVRQLIEFTHLAPEGREPDPRLQEMAYRQVAWCYALARHLRRQNPLTDVNALLSNQELTKLETQDNVPNALLLTQARQVQTLFRQGDMQVFQAVALEETLTRLTNSMGGCERIKNTTFPTSYRYLVRLLLTVFVLALPFGLAEMPPVGLFATALIVELSFLAIDRTADYLQDPFENLPSDTPMLGLSRTIEINVKEMLGESELPEKAMPVNGVLY